MSLIVWVVNQYYKGEKMKKIDDKIENDDLSKELRGVGVMLGLMVNHIYVLADNVKTLAEQVRGDIS